MKKKTFFSVAILMAAVVLLWKVSVIGNFTTKAQAFISTEALPVIVTAKEIQYKTEAIDINMKVPVLHQLKNDKLQNQLNILFEKDLLEYKKEIEEFAQEALQESEKAGWEFRHYMLMTDYTIHYNKNNLLSISITLYQYTGGAHGNTDVASYNIDLAAGKILSIKDLFLDGVNYKNFIARQVKGHMESYPELYYADVIQTFEGVSDRQSFYIEDNHLVIYFGLYEVAPYAAGIPKIKIPFTALEDLLKTEYIDSLM